MSIPGERLLFKNLGRALALLRELRGKSQAQLARAAGIGKSQLSKYETGKELPKLESLEKVLGALTVGYFEFFYTLHLLDQRGSSLGVLPNDFGSASLGVWAIGGLSHLSPETEKGFGNVFTLLLRLYRQVFESALRSGAHRENTYPRRMDD
ncbi:MAG TPA: helix-turn-helix transcriptional regulator [Thermoanaerobaculia bacterium]|jgi:transcriptional regulator with XRE-family HTH domain|nr:helix-turn-helix transcriptional regulator [Thermoanaerobaculia bacterium]